ncbi:MAG TPA: tyrosine-protein phosphatase [Bacteroidales bacterium]|nr:tyrosine-protein phosphatase [Bacteroidales bacterium]
MSEIQTLSDVNFKSILNFRDLGGKVPEGDKKIKKGIIFRSANLDKISKKDIEKLHLLNIRTIIDLRAPVERKDKNGYTEHIDRLSLPLDFEQATRSKLKPLLYKKDSETLIDEITNSLYLEILDAALPAFKEVLEVLLSPERHSVLIHCQAGKDRTGVICALIYLVLGVEKQYIIEDYLKSNDAIIPYFKKKLLIRKILFFGFFPSRAILHAITVRQRNIESVLDRIDDHYGGIEAYLEMSGFDTSRSKELREKLIVK